jgi:RNase II-type exonuclease C-terminal S1 domain
VVTGASEKGVYVRVFDPPAEGRVMRGSTGMDVGDQVRVTLLSTDPQRGFIDFGRA